MQLRRSLGTRAMLRPKLRIFEEKTGRRSAAKLLTKDEARGIAATALIFALPQTAKPSADRAANGFAFIPLQCPQPPAPWAVAPTGRIAIPPDGR